ncbi:hypothetical protein M9H77_28847 [Catharanthus roseus]|uniref:Uncharacterized protein n=1 Tax=Catharanthus roseus TaxID=4058 RepID=A0ACC0AGV8_CATRO|nr:hypothetical protein M9H77_28847 [Catharanthus roseus]
MASKVNIPQDALIEILLQLPVKSLIRPLFIDMHLKFSLTRDDDFFLIKRILNDDNTHQTLLSLHVDDESLSILVHDLEILSFIDESLGIKPLNYDFPGLMDINTKVFHKFGYPKANKTSTDERYYISNNTLTLISYDGYRSSNPYFFEQFIDVWIMKEYSNEESWSKQYSIEPFIGISSPISIWKNNRIFLKKVVRGYLDRDKLVQLAACDLFNCEQLLMYNNIHGKCEFSMEVVFYKETLVSIGRN